MVEDSLGARLFAETKSVEGFYLQVNMLHGDELKQKENTLIFMDEIQAYPHLLTLLKVLFQDNQFTYIAKGGEDNLSADLLCDALGYNRRTFIRCSAKSLPGDPIVKAILVRRCFHQNTITLGGIWHFFLCGIALEISLLLY